MPNNRPPYRKPYHKPRFNSALSAYEMCLIAGVLVTVEGGELRFDPEEKMTPILRRQVEANKAGLIAHLRKVQAMHDETLGKVLDNAKELGF